MKVKIRTVVQEDVSSLPQLIAQVEHESLYMLYEGGERNITEEKTETLIRSTMNQHNSTILIAEKNHQPVGYVMAFGGNAIRNQHSAYVVIGIVKHERGQGIGKRLFDELFRWANEQNLHRLELTVVTENEPGISLYKKMGFQIEGTKKHSLFIDKDFYDEYYMAKLL
ncbi:GNAT family N-acetyltransferase [Salirhabdus salicampi]|uniref:GNAT family N-acetyltransferase n=1 Tax=Salirhabdus salicampi TaxID=476102 RepID=UPI0020C3199B|nr:GNAT family N-acetyltransferase [Salirhabdus salicampi]MCP8615798.1 GNAT family N-acetyltransferase [Salirhabdus salicampi]